MQRKAIPSIPSLIATVTSRDSHLLLSHPRLHFALLVYNSLYEVESVVREYALWCYHEDFFITQKLLLSGENWLTSRRYSTSYFQQFSLRKIHSYRILVGLTIIISSPTVRHDDLPCTVRIPQPSPGHRFTL